MLDISFIFLQDSKLKTAYRFGCIPRPGGRYCVDSLKTRFDSIAEVREINHV